MTFALVQTYAAQGNSLINRTVISYHCSFSNYHAAAMVNQNSVSHLRSRMNFNQRKKTGNLRNHTGYKKHSVLIKPVSKPMPNQSMNPLVQQKHLQRTACSRIPLLNSLNIQPNILQNHSQHLILLLGRPGRLPSSPQQKTF